MKVTSKFVLVDGIKTHYLEAGDGPALVLLHSGEFGGASDLTWEYNIPELAKHFRVLAPDMLGYGKTAKLFDFGNMWQARIHHVARFLEIMCVGKAHFMGNSMGGTILLGHAAESEPEWDIDRMIVVSGGGTVPETETRQLLNTYDGTREHMERIIRAVYMRKELHDDSDFIDRRHQSSLEPGAWECTAAPRFRSPFTPPRGYGVSSGYEAVRAPTLIIAGEKDNLRLPEYGEKLQTEVPDSSLIVMLGAGHCPQVDRPDDFNTAAINFLTSDRTEPFSKSI